LLLYKKYLELQENGIFERVLKEIYAEGWRRNWKIGEKDEPPAQSILYRPPSVPLPITYSDRQTSAAPTDADDGRTKASLDDKQAISDARTTAEEETDKPVQSSTETNLFEDAKQANTASAPESRIALMPEGDDVPPSDKPESSIEETTATDDDNGVAETNQFPPFHTVGIGS
jgi:hypothetical protein